MLGSSTAAGVGAPAGQGWVERLAVDTQARGVTLHNLARSGLLTSQALPAGTPVQAPELPPQPGAGVDDALGRQPKLLLLSFPSNDAVAGVSPQATLANYTRLRERASAAGVAVLALSSQPRNGIQPSVRAAQDSVDIGLRQLFGDCFVELRALLSAPDGSIAPDFSAGDGVHLNTSGHKIVADEVLRALNTSRCVRLAQT